MDEDEIRNLPIISWPGSEDWEKAARWALELEAQFPEQDADQFAYACEYNEMGPTEKLGIVLFKMNQRGERDGDDWIWRIVFEDGSAWKAVGWCDYTGWDCQSNLCWEKVSD